MCIVHVNERQSNVHAFAVDAAKVMELGWPFCYASRHQRLITWSVTCVCVYFLKLI